jgi:hypothetical protein
MKQVMRGNTIDLWLLKHKCQRRSGSEMMTRDKKQRSNSLFSSLFRTKGRVQSRRRHSLEVLQHLIIYSTNPTEPQRYSCNRNVPVSNNASIERAAFDSRICMIRVIEPCID